MQICEARAESHLLCAVDMCFSCAWHSFPLLPLPLPLASILPQSYIASAKIRNSNFKSHFKPRSSCYHPSQLQKIPSQQQQQQQQCGNSSSSSSSSSSIIITNAIPNLHHKMNHLFQNLLNPLFVNSPPINHSFHACVHNIGMKELKENSYKKCQER